MNRSLLTGWFALHTHFFLIPYPASLEDASSSGLNDTLTLGPDAALTVQPGNLGAISAASLLEGALRRATGISLPVRATDVPGPGGIHLTGSSADPTLGNEGYCLSVEADGVTVTATAGAGFFYGGQTLLQLLPPVARHSAPVSIPLCSIRDMPRYPWRGMMLDVARHFFPADEVKRLINVMAHYKLNRLHLHLTDDQGWRLEIQSRPELTSRGASSAVGGGPGGFYSRTEYADLVAYAARRHITIVPEIDMPGHVNAALSACPDLNPDGRAPAPYTGTDVGFSSLAVDRDETWRFVADVVKEAAALTPGPYLHIGGDEADATSPSDYRHFIARVHEIVTQAGKQMVGWEEIASVDDIFRKESSAPIVQHWKTSDLASAVQRGARVILSPANRIYLDMKYTGDTPLGLTWAGTVSVQHAYNWDPDTLLPDVSPSAILGVEAPLWTETIEIRDDLDHMVFPRLLGCAEIGWTPAADRNWDAYRERLAAHGPRLASYGIAFHRTPEVDWVE